MKKLRLSVIGITALRLFFFILLTTGCKKKFDTPGSGIPGSGVNDNEMVTGGITGNVVDENNQPVRGATVTSGTNTTTTDRYGSFRFSNISLSKANGRVKVVVPGYFNAYRTFVSVAGRINNVRIKLIPKTNSGNFSAAAEGTVNITGGAKLIMPANAITNAAGVAYSGTVNVAMTWIDPSSPDLPNVLMGDLRGIATSGAEMGLSTYGMLGVELTDMGGQPLKIASGKTAELTFPIPSTMLGNAPATIDLWYFDEATARWKQEGTATKTGSNYVANVNHFSFWNCDGQFPMIDLCMSFKEPNGNPLINAQVRIRRLVNNTYGYGRTDAEGNICGKVPKDEALVLEVLDICGGVVYSQNIGPFSGNTTLPAITITIIPSAGLLTITGTITNCSGGNVTNGAAFIFITGGNIYYVPVSNGTFSVTIVKCTTTGVTYFSVLGYDFSTSQQSNPVSNFGITGTVNVGILQACNTSQIEFIEYLSDHVITTTTYISPQATFSSPDSIPTGPYTYKTGIFAFTLWGTHTSFSFSSYGIPASSLPLNSAFITLGLATNPQQILTPNPTINITAYGPPVTGFIEGNFSIQALFSGIPRNVYCTFRVRN